MGIRKAYQFRLSALITVVGNRHFVTAFLAVVVFSVYFNSLNVPFIFDDYTYIQDNPAVRDMRNILSPARIDITNVDADVVNNVTTRPLSYLSFGINYTLHGFSVTGYHVVNIGLHIANAILLYLLLSALAGQLIDNQYSYPAERRRMACLANTSAFVATLLFAVHPVQTNVVTYITQRMASLATFWYLLATFLYVVWRRGRNRGWLPYAGALAATVAGMYSKEICFTLPLMLTFIEMMFFSDRLKARLSILSPFLITMAVIPIRITGMTIQSSGSLSDALVDSVNLMNTEGGTSSYQYFVTQLRVIVTYLRILFVPYDLHLDRQFPRYDSIGQPEVFLSGLFLLMLALGALYLIRRSRNLHGRTCLCMRMTAFGIIWFFVTLSVESSVIPINSVIFEYRLYLPSIGFFCAVVYGLGGLISGRSNVASPWTARATGGLTSFIVVILAVATVARNRTWQDDELFWRDAIAKSPNRYGNYVSLAHVLRDRGRVTEALGVLKEQAQRNPQLVHPVYEMGMLCLDTGNPEQAIEHLFTALANKPDQPEIYRGLVMALLYVGNQEGAATLYRRARAMFPNIRPIVEMEARL